MSIVEFRADIRTHILIIRSLLAPEPWLGIIQNGPEQAEFRKVSYASLCICMCGGGHSRRPRDAHEHYQRNTVVFSSSFLSIRIIPVSLLDSNAQNGTRIRVHMYGYLTIDLLPLWYYYYYPNNKTFLHFAVLYPFLFLVLDLWRLLHNFYILVLLSLGSAVFPSHHQVLSCPVTSAPIKFSSFYGLLSKRENQICRKWATYDLFPRTGSRGGFEKASARSDHQVLYTYSTVWYLSAWLHKWLL